MKEKDVRIIDLSADSILSLLNSPIYNDFNSIRLSNNICRICLFELVLLSLDRERENFLRTFKRPSEINSDDIFTI